MEVGRNLQGLAYVGGGFSRGRSAGGEDGEFSGEPVYGEEERELLACGADGGWAGWCPGTGMRFVKPCSRVNLF